MATTRPEGGMSRADRLAAAVIRGLPVTGRRLDLAGISTPVLEGGQGPPLVLLHGQGAFAESWASVIPSLLRDYRIVAPDLPGLGRSEVRTVALAESRLVDWLGELIAQTCAQPPALVGISLGGTFSAHFAIEHSDRVRRVVLVDSGSLGPFRPPPGALLALIRYSRRPSPAAFARFGRYVLAHPQPAPDDPNDPRAAFVAYHVDRASEASVRTANRWLVRWSTRPIPVERLRKITAPVALIWGRNDRIMRFKFAEAASAALGWPLYPIDDCGHVPFVERPAEFLQALEAALSDRT